MRRIEADRKAQGLDRCLAERLEGKRSDIKYGYMTYSVWLEEKHTKQNDSRNNTS